MDSRIEQIKMDYENIFSQEAGQRVLKDLMLSCMVDKSTFSSDSLKMAFNEGKREVGLHIKYMAEPKSKKDDKKKAIK